MCRFVVEGVVEEQGTVENLVVHAGVVVLFCGYMDFTVDGLLKWWPLALLLFGLSFPKVFLPTLESLGSGTDAGSLVVGAFLALCLFTFVSPVYVLRQFVVRFQGLNNSLRDFDESNRPPATEPTLLKQTQNEYAAQKTTAVVVAALRPMGKVKIGEKELNARHIFGTFIDSGTTVMVTGMQNGLLLVREANIGADFSSGSD